MLLGPNDEGIKCVSKNKEQARIQFQQVYGNQLSRDAVTSVIDCNFSAIEHFFDLSRQVTTSYHLISLLLGHKVTYSLQFYAQVVKHLDARSAMCENKF